MGEVASAAIALPPIGTDRTLDIGSWNIEWLGAKGNGPTNEALQLTNAVDLIGAVRADVWGLAEIVDATAFRSLASRAGFAGVLANDPAVAGGSASYSASEQKTAVLYRGDLFRFEGARVILADQDYAFAGRPPLEVSLRYAAPAGDVVPLRIIVLHMKAEATTAAYARRRTAANALEEYLGEAALERATFVVGDWNDDLDGSIVSGRASPFAALEADADRYFFPTRTLSDAGETSTVGYDDMIDHHMATGFARGWYVAGSARVVRGDRYIARYGSTTSDHYPVVTRWRP
jgi:hypothetical protein